MSVFNYADEAERENALDSTTQAVRDGKLVVLPTDTVYGIGADAFSRDAVQALLDAKGRGREYPPPVLIGDANVLHALAVDVPAVAEDLAEAFWPGALTLIVKAQPSLMWDLGETKGTVGLRMPNSDAALELLKRTGPLAVSSANKHGRPAAVTVIDAATQLGDAVAVYLDAGRAELGESSTIIDVTVEPPQILRPGAITKEQIEERFGPIFDEPEREPDLEAASEEGAEAATEAEIDSEPELKPEGDTESIGAETTAPEDAASQ